MDPYFIKHLWRKRISTAVTAVFCAVLCALICYLSVYVANEEAELENVRENMDIKCVVTNARGSQTTDLGIREKYIDFVMDEDSPFHPYVRDVVTTKYFYDEGNRSFIGVSNEVCVDVLDPAMGGSYRTDVDFFNSSDYVCLVSAEQYETLKGTTVSAEIYDPRAKNEDNTVRHRPYSFQVVGYYAGEGDTVYIPIRTAIEMASKISSRGYYKLEEMCFFVKDNSKLDEMKKAAKEVFIEALPTNDRVSVNFALVFYDSNYLTTVATLKQSIGSTKLLLPFIMALGLGLGFVISYLSTRGESRRYALMRALGMTKGKLFFSVLREQSAVPAAVAVITAVVFASPLPALEFLLFYEAGCMISVSRVIKIRPVIILKES